MMNILDIYAQYPITLVKGDGMTVSDSEGKEYTDYYGGHGVISVGHSHPHFKEAIKNQLDQLAFYSNAFKNPLQQKLASALGELSGLPEANLFLSNSGAEANENAVKAASFLTGRSKVLALSGAFHGRTAGAVAMTDNKNIQAPFGSALEVDFVPIDQLDVLEDKLKTRTYAAFIMEGIQGVNGVWEASTAFWQAARSFCDETETILVADEVQSGYGRSGKFFAHQYHEVEPDMITLGKGMGNGFPVAGTIISAKYSLDKGMLGTTFGGGQLACAAAISVLDIMAKEKLVQNAFDVGNYLKEELLKLDVVKAVRGRGLMLGIEFSVSGKAVRNALLQDQAIITGFSAPDILRILPPLGVNVQQAEQFIHALEEVLKGLK